MTTAWKALGIGVVLAVWAASSPAADRPVFSVESGVFSQYVWRGMLPTNGPVLQNSATVLWRGAHLNLWTNLDLNSANGRRGKFNEVDFDAGYDRSMEKVGFSVGATRYAFPNTPAAATTEVYAGATLAVKLRPAVKAYLDVDVCDLRHIAQCGPAPAAPASEMERGTGGRRRMGILRLQPEQLRSPRARADGFPSRPGRASWPGQALARHPADRLRRAGPQSATRFRGPRAPRLRSRRHRGIHALVP